MNYNTVIIFKLLCLCVDAEVHRERQTAGADSGLPGQRVRCGSSAGGRRDQERSAGTHGGTAGAQHTGRYTAHTHTHTYRPATLTDDTSTKLCFCVPVELQASGE